MTAELAPINPPDDGRYDEFVPSGEHDFVWRKGNEAIRLKAPPNDGIRFFRVILWAIVVSSLFWIPMLVEIFWGIQ